MGAPNVEQLPEFNYGYVQREQRKECPKYSWSKMDPYERIGVNLMDAVGARNAVWGGLFGLFIFAIVLVFFRQHAIDLLSGTLFKKKE